MGTTNYVRFGNRIIGERPFAGSRTNYATDALGSVTGTLVGAALQNTYAYKPHGSQLAKSGAGADPAFQWVGASGYVATAKSYANVYVRSRSFATATGRWTTRDPLWPNEGAFTYVNCNPTSYVDPSGLQLLALIAANIDRDRPTRKYPLCYGYTTRYLFSQQIIYKDPGICTMARQGEQVSDCHFTKWATDTIASGLKCPGTGPYTFKIPDDIGNFTDITVDDTWQCYLNERFAMCDPWTTFECGTVNGRPAWVVTHQGTVGTDVTSYNYYNATEPPVHVIHDWSLAEFKHHKEIVICDGSFYMLGQ